MRRLRYVASCGLVAFTGVSQAQLTNIEWIGTSGGSWNDPANWSIYAVPANSGSRTYAVTIGAGQSVNFDASAATAVTSLIHGDSNAKTTVGAGSLTVLGQLRGTVDVRDGQFFSAATAVGGMDSSRVFVTGAGLARSSASQYDGINAFFQDSSLFAANGPGSVLDLSSLQVLKYGPTSGYWRQSIDAVNGGQVNLSGLQTIQNNAGQDDQVTFRQNGGTLQLGALSSIDNTSHDNSYVIFAVDTGTLSLPALTTTRGNLQAFISSGARLNTPVLASHDGLTNVNNRSVWVVNPNATFSAPQLSRLRFTTLEVASGGTFNAPNLTDVTGSVLRIASGSSFSTGTLSAIDVATIMVGAGQSGPNVSDQNYTLQGYFASADVLSASGAGAVLNLSSLRDIEFGADVGSFVHTVRATAGGLIDLSGVQFVRSRVGQDDTIAFVASGGTIDLRNLTPVQAVGNGFDRVIFEAGAEGTIRLGNLIGSQRIDLRSTNATGRLVINGGIGLDAESTLNLAPLTELTAVGDFTHSMTAETSFLASGAVLAITGSQTQRLELAGSGAAGAAAPGNSGNFGFGQLKVGAPSLAATVELVDVFNNGNRGPAGEAEALYLFGLGGPQGLVMQGGSAIILSNLNVYTTENGEWKSLQTLLGNNTIVPYTFGGSDGFILKNPQSQLLRWVDGADTNSWDTAENWDWQVTPLAPHRVELVRSGGGTVNGPAAAERVQSLLIDSTSSATPTTLRLSSGGAISVADTLVIGQRGAMEVSHGVVTAHRLINGRDLSVSGGIVQTEKLMGRGQLRITNGGMMRLLAASESSEAIASRTRSVDANGGRLDLGMHGLIVDYDGSSPIDSVRQQILAARQDGSWSGLGIMSDFLLSDSQLAIGYGEAWRLGKTSFLDESVDATSVLIRATCFGDATLDGVVNLDDFTAMAAGFGVGGSWSNGDFNYDQQVNLHDFTALVANFGRTLSFDFQLASRGAVPEPSIGAAGAAVALMGLRRRIRR